jgi:Methyltransferase domain
MTNDIIERLKTDKPMFHGGGTRQWNALPEALREIQRAVRSGMRTLETGCGASTVIFAAQGARHTVISPTVDEHERVKAYLGTVGIDHSHLNFVAGFSDEVLPQICRERIYDYVFIDGAHSFPYPAVDWHYARKALKIGGQILLDDVPIRAVSCVYRYMITDSSWRLENVLDNRATVFRLVSEPAPEDHTLQAYNRFPDFAFASLPKKAYLTAASEAKRLRGRLGQRFPRVRARWQRWRA